MTKIYIRNLKIRTLIGVGDKERRSNQDLWVNIELVYDASKAVASDHISDAVDYQTLSDAIIRRAEKSHYYLIEKLADVIMDMVMSYPAVREAKVTIDKPKALKAAESVAVEISRKRHE